MFELSNSELVFVIIGLEEFQRHLQGTWEMSFIEARKGVKMVFIHLFLLF